MSTSVWDHKIISTCINPMTLRQPLTNVMASENTGNLSVPSTLFSSNGSIFRVTGPLCGEFTGPGEFPTQRPVTRSFDVFFDQRLNKRLSKQPWGWWSETPSSSLWRHRNEKFSYREEESAGDRQSPQQCKSFTMSVCLSVLYCSIRMFYVCMYGLLPFLMTIPWSNFADICRIYSDKFSRIPAPNIISEVPDKRVWLFGR